MVSQSSASRETWIMAGPQFPLSNTLFCRVDACLVVSVHGHSVAVAAELAVGAWADGSVYQVSTRTRENVKIKLTCCCCEDQRHCSP
jgi:hypothetical protein